MMELEEMTSLWAEMSMEIEKQKKLTDTIVIKMTRDGYRNKMRKILIPEVTGTLVCLAGLLFILINFQKLNTWYLQVCGIVAALIVCLLPILSVKAIRGLRSVNISANNYRQSLFEYSKGKIQFVFIQKLSFYLGAILMLVILPVMGQFIGGKDLFKENWLWIFYSIGFPFFYAFSKWVFKSYIKITEDAENILKELDR